jgi:Helix-turn-helix domain
MRRKPSYPPEEYDPRDWKPIKRRKRKLVALGGLHDAHSAAAKLKVSEDTLAGYVRAGELRFINVGKGTMRPRYRFTDSDLDAFIAARTTSQETTPCPSFAPRKANRITGIRSSNLESGFMARRNAQIAEKLKR